MGRRPVEEVGELLQAGSPAGDPLAGAVPECHADRRLVEHGREHLPELLGRRVRTRHVVCLTRRHERVHRGRRHTSCCDGELMYFASDPARTAVALDDTTEPLERRSARFPTLWAGIESHINGLDTISILI